MKTRLPQKDNLALFYHLENLCLLGSLSLLGL